MIKHIIFSVFFALGFAPANYVFAQAQDDGGVSNSSSSGSNGTSGNSSAGAASAMGKIAGAANIGLGAKLVTKCPVDTVSCMMGVMSLAQGVMSFQSAKSAEGVANDFDYGAGEFPLTDSNFGFPSTSPSVTFNGQTFTPQDLNNLEIQAQSDLQRLSGLGFSTDTEAGTVTANGKTASISTVGTGYGAAKAGLIDESQIEEYDEAMKKLKKNKISVVSMPGAGSGGGGRAAARAYKPSSYKSGLEGFKFNMDNQRKPASAKTEGLTKNFGRDPVGTSTDNIFEMLHRNYQKRVQQRQFVQ